MSLRVVPAVFSAQSQGDGCYRIIASTAGGGWELEGGPYADEYQAAMVCQAMLILAGDDDGWPGAFDPDDDPDDDPDAGVGAR